MPKIHLQFLGGLAVAGSGDGQTVALGELAPLGAPAPEGADEELVDDGQNGRRRGEKAGVGSGSVG